MKAALLVFLLFVSTTFGLTVEDLQSGQLKTSSLPVGGNLAQPMVFRIWVPENTLNVNVTFTNEDPLICGNLYLWSSPTPFCAPEGDTTGMQFFCSEGHLEQSSDSPVSFTFDTTSLYSRVGYNFAPGNYLYLSVQRVGQENEACPFSVKSFVNTCPSVNQRPTRQTVCTTIDRLSAPVNTTFQVQGVQAPTPWYASVDVPIGTGSVKGTVVTTTPNLALAARSFVPPFRIDVPPTPQGAQCFSGAPTQDDTQYTYTIECIVPRAGPLHFIFLSLVTETFDMSVHFELLNCPANTGGPACAFQTSEFDPVADKTASFSLDPLTTRYFYFDVPAGSEGGFNLSFTADNYGYQFLRKDAFWSSADGGSDSNNQNVLMEPGVPPPTFRLLPEDLFVGGRFYFGVENPADPLAVSMNADLQVQLPPTPTSDDPADTTTESPQATTETADTTTPLTTQTETTEDPTNTDDVIDDSSAAVFLPSFLAVFFALVILL